MNNCQIFQFQDIAGKSITNSYDIGCPHRCEQNDFSIIKANLGTNTEGNKNKTSLWAQFALPVVTVEEEYRLFDTVAIISATGGSLGLFLGLSCYSVIWTGFEWLQAVLFRFKNEGA